MNVYKRISGTAHSSVNQITNVRDIAKNVNVNDVADSICQLTESVKNISDNSQSASKVAQEAVGIAHTTDSVVRSLLELSKGIGNVIKVITTVAEQTNLLALNATIEAARAGVLRNSPKKLRRQPKIYPVVSLLFKMIATQQHTLSSKSAGRYQRSTTCKVKSQPVSKISRKQQRRSVGQCRRSAVTPMKLPSPFNRAVA